VYTVSPLNSKLYSQDAGAQAAAHREVLQMAWRLVIRQSGLLQELSQVVSEAFQLLTTCADTATDCLDKAPEPCDGGPRPGVLGLEGGGR